MTAPSDAAGQERDATGSCVSSEARIAELERRVEERTGQLMRAADALREAQAQLAHVNRVTTMGQLVSSILHEVMQPITAGFYNALAAFHWLSSQTPSLEAALQALDLAVKDGDRAIDVIARVRAFMKNTPPRKDAFAMNEAIVEVIRLTHGELAKNSISVKTHLAEALPHVHGDRIQLQQVLLNLIINAVEAMASVGEGSRELLIATGNDPSGGVLVTVRDSGRGLRPESFDRLFDAFYTTTPNGIGLGLSICRSIVEAHAGQIWASRGVGPGATFQFTLPLASAPQA